MRKSNIFAMTFLSCVLISGAVCAETTQRRNIIDFCELYSYRAGKYEASQSGLVFDLHPLSNSWNTRIESGKSYVITSCGSGNIYDDDSSISDMTMTLVDLCDGDLQNQRTYAICVLGFSALEYDALGEHMLSLNSTVNGDASNATDESFRIFDEVIEPSLSDDVYSRVMNNGEEILIYSGNYDYYLSYSASSSEESADGNDHEYLFVTGRERE